MLNKDEMRFQARVTKICIDEFNASCEDDDAQPFLDQLYREYREAGEPDRDSWIRNRLANQFRSVAKPPRWVEEEPNWPFHEGKPMVFIGQFSLPQNEITKNHLTWDEDVYLFGARMNRDRGYTIEYRIVTQNSGIDGVGDR